MMVKSNENLYLVYIKDSRVRDVQVNLAKKPKIDNLSEDNNYFNAEEEWEESWVDMEGELVAGLIRTDSKDSAIFQVMKRLNGADKDAFGVFELKEI